MHHTNIYMDGEYIIASSDSNFRCKRRGMTQLRRVPLVERLIIL
jgi:hypothetical protein